MSALLVVIVFAAALGCGVIGGVFFAFSTFVMTALRRLPPAQGIAAMQAINVAVINPWFLSVFLGTAVCCGVLLVHAVVHWGGRAAPWLLAGSLLYCLGTFMVTMVCNVPRNNALAAAAPNAADTATLWVRYLREWTAWNHVRTAASLAATAALLRALALHN